MALIKTGWTYRFQFLPDFQSYDGTYTIAKIFSWDELIQDKISLFDLSFEPLNISKETYENKVLEYRTLDTYKLTSIDGEKELFVNEGMLANVPLYPVKRYGKLVLFLPLGIYDEEEGLDYIINQVKEEIHGALGITHDPAITAVEYQYLTESEYKQIAADRHNNITSVMNYFSENVKLREQVSRLQAQINGLEQLIAHLG